MCSTRKDTVSQSAKPPKTPALRRGRNAGSRKPVGRCGYDHIYHNRRGRMGDRMVLRDIVWGMEGARMISRKWLVLLAALLLIGSASAYRLCTWHAGWQAPFCQCCPGTACPTPTITITPTPTPVPTFSPKPTLTHKHPTPTPTIVPTVTPTTIPTTEPPHEVPEFPLFLRGRT